MDYKEPQTRLDVLKAFKESLFGKENLWDDAHFILAEVPLHKAETEKILPPGLRLSDPPAATVFIVDYKKTSFTEPYKEAAVLVHVRTPLGRGVHCPWMLVDDDTALIYGRELLGYPKKIGQFTFIEQDGCIAASVSRRGVTILEITGERGEKQDNPQPVFDKKTFNAGGPGQLFLLNPLWLFHPTEVIHESWDADVKVTVRASENDPIANLISGPATSGRIVVMDIPGGKYHIPIGLAGLMHMGRTFPMRFR